MFQLNAVVSHTHALFLLCFLTLSQPSTHSSEDRRPLQALGQRKKNGVDFYLEKNHCPGALSEGKATK